MVSFFGKVRSGISFIGAGMFDRFTSRFTGRRCSFAKHVAVKLSSCEPWTDHFEASALSGISSALSAGDFASARGLAAFGTKEGASEYCIKLAEKTISLIAMGCEPEVELYMSFLD